MTARTMQHIEPEISVVIPVYNRESLIVRSLDSIVSQDWNNIHIIVVDNNSTDNSYSVVENWGKKNLKEGDSRRLTLLRESHPGAAAARKRGMAAVTSDYVMFFDSDDVMSPGSIKRIMQSFIENQEAQIVCWRVRFHFLDGKVRTSHVPHGNLIEGHLIHCYLSTQRYAAKTELVTVAGNWNESAMAWNDWELGVRLLLQNPKVVCLNEVGADMYCQVESITGTGFTARAGVWEKSLQLAEDAIKNSDSPDKERLLRLIDYRRIVLAAIYKREGSNRLAEKLRKEVIGKVSPQRRFLYNLIYTYTSLGLRGAYILFNPFL